MNVYHLGIPMNRFQELLQKGQQKRENKGSKSFAQIIKYPDVLYQIPLILQL